MTSTPERDRTRASPHIRSRIGCALAVVVTIAAGLASRQFASLLPSFLGKYPGDALWALMVFFAWGAILPAASTRRVVTLTLLVSFAIEVLKLWQAPWLVAIRQSTAGHLVFGHVFSWQNLVAYTAGAMLGAAFEWTMAAARPIR